MLMANVNSTLQVATKMSADSELFSTRTSDLTGQHLVLGLQLLNCSIVRFKHTQLLVKVQGKIVI